MIGLLLVIAIWFLIGGLLVRWEVRRPRGSREDVVGMAMGCLFLGGMLTGTFIMMFSVFLSCWNTFEFKAREVHPIVSLRSSDQVQGVFFLGCGTVGTTEYYYFMYDLGGGRYMRDTAPACNVVIQETSTEKPNFSKEVWKERIPAGIGLWWPLPLIPQEEQKRNWVLTVPPGTVIQRFEVK